MTFFMSIEFKSALFLLFKTFAGFLRWLDTISVPAVIKVRSIAEQKFCLGSDQTAFVYRFSAV